MTPQSLLLRIYMMSISKQFDNSAILNPIAVDNFRLLNINYRIKGYLRDVITSTQNFFYAVFHIKKGRFYKNNFIKNSSHSILDSK